MLKKLLFILLLACPAWAGNSVRTAQNLGWLLQNVPNVSSTVLSTTSTWEAYGFVPAENHTLSAVNIFIGALTGVVLSSDAVCALYTDNVSSPGVVLQSVTLGSSVVSLAVNKWSGFSTPLTAGVQYWLVFENLDTSPATNNYTVRFVPGFEAIQTVGGLSGSTSTGWNNRETVSSGGAWQSSNASSVGGMRIDYTDGTYDGVPVSTRSVVSSNTDSAFSTNEAGVLFNAPSYANINVCGASLGIVKSGAPTGQMAFKLYNGTTLLGTTNGISSGTVSASSFQYPLYFPSPITLPAGSQDRLTVVQLPTASASNANSYTAFQYNVPADPISEGLFPFGMQKTSWNGSSWTQDPTIMYSWTLLLCNGNEFAPGSVNITPGSGQIIIR